MTDAEQQAQLAAMVAAAPERTPEQEAWWREVDRGVLALPDWLQLRATWRERFGEEW